MRMSSKKSSGGGQVLKHLGLWEVKGKPSSRANGPPLIPDSYPASRCRDEASGEGGSVDDYVTDSDPPVDLSGVVRRTKTEAYF